MVDEKINRIIEELIGELKSKYSDFRGIYLFGLHARGEANEDSDIDLAIIFDREIDWRFKDAVRDIIIEKEIEYSVIIDSHIFNSNDIIKPKELIIDEINTKGILYGC
ncbi:MAG: nucleotidyltransferase domain-containing protein [Bacteroidetes bacterium]|nr:MAG: nucleotidyltransferase domain-containing protein [Bacteroidota bacterium]